MSNDFTFVLEREAGDEKIWLDFFLSIPQISAPQSVAKVLKDSIPSSHQANPLTSSSA